MWQIERVMQYRWILLFYIDFFAVLTLWVVKSAKSKEKLRAELLADELARLRAESLDIVGDRHIGFIYGYWWKLIGNNAPYTLPHPLLLNSSDWALDQALLME
jgi:hypothetical protein